jgi:hypothetical protein
VGREQRAVQATFGNVTEVFQRRRRTQKVPLDKSAAEAPQGGQLTGSLDPFGDYF